MANLITENDIDFFHPCQVKKTTIFSSTQQLFRRLKKIPLQTVHRSFWFGLSLFTTIHSLVCQTQSRAGGLVDSLGRFFFSFIFIFFAVFCDRRPLDYPSSQSSFLLSFATQKLSLSLSLSLFFFLPFSLSVFDSRTFCFLFVSFWSLSLFIIRLWCEWIGYKGRFSWLSDSFNTNMKNLIHLLNFVFLVRNCCKWKV